MLKRYGIALLFSVTLWCAVHAQSNKAGALADDSLSSDTKPEETSYKKPTVGLGTGVLSFYGDLTDKKFQNPALGRPATDLHISTYVTPHLQLTFYTMFGKLGENERLTGDIRNINFESQIKLGGIHLSYIFLPHNKIASPFISTGFESFEFLSKTDLYDQNGNEYYYWSDGSIRSIPQNAPNASNAKILERNYSYESDVRKLNNGTYKEQSFAIPIGVGVIMHLTSRCDLKIGTTLHCTFTDYIDGITSKGIGNMKGNSANDKFLMTAFSLHYVLPTRGGEKETGYEEDGGEDLFAFETDDSDNDGVVDFKDSCQGTPAGVKVDAKGCPLDSDGDGVPDYLDKEPNSPKGAFVNSDGIQLTDSLILLQYLTYIDSTGQFAKIEVREEHGSSGLTRHNKVYSVQLGVFKNGISSDLMTKFLSIGDINSTFVDDSTAVYTSGTFNNYIDAENRKKQLIEDGIAGAKVVYKKGDQFVEAPPVTAEKEKPKSKNDTKVKDNKATEKANPVLPTPILAKGQVVFRVQLGAYSKKLSGNVFPDIQNLIEIHQEDGLYKYLAGSYTTMQEAAKYRIELLTKGYSNAIIAAYKDGKRVPLSSVGATLSDKTVKENIEEPSKPTSSVNKKLVVFKVQIGIYKENPPADIRNKFKVIKEGVTPEKTQTGLTRYVAGSFDNYKDALEFKNKLAQKYNITGAFIVAKFNNQYISLQEALELTKE